MDKDFYNSLYRYIIIDFELKSNPKALKKNKEEHSDKEDWKITEGNITYGYKARQTKKYILEDWLIHNKAINGYIKNYVKRANKAKARQLSNRLFMQAIRIYQNRELSPEQSLNNKGE